MNTAAEPLRLTVRVDRPPHPLRLRAALDRRLRGEPQPPGPEAQIAEAVAAAISARKATPPWR